MSKEKIKKMTFNDYIIKAKQKEKAKNTFKDIEISNQIIVVKKMSDEKLLELMDSMDETVTMKENVSVFKEVIYLSVPELQKKELQDNFKLVEPTDIVTKIFEIGEIVDLATKIMDIYGLNDIGSDIKN